MGDLFLGDASEHILVWQGDPEGVRGRLDGWGGHASIVELIDAADSRSIAFDEAEAKEDLREAAIPRFRDPKSDIKGGKAGQETAKRDELHLLVIHVDDDAAGIGIIPMDDRVKKRFPDRFRGIIRMIDPLISWDDGDGLVAEAEIGEGVLEVFENRSREFFAIPEFRAGFVVIDADFDLVRSLIGKKQCEVREKAVLLKAKPPELLL